MLLERWLEQRWSEAGASLQLDFARLLEQPDPQLAAWLLQGERPADPGCVALVDDILRCRP